MPARTLGALKVDEGRVEDVIQPLDYEDDDLYMNVYVRGALGIQYTSATRTCGNHNNSTYG